MNIPNLLTFLRIALIPVFVIAFMAPVEWGRAASMIIFVLASVTDWLDGYFARKLNQQSKLGAFLDPVADKLMVVTALVMLLWAYGGNTILMLAALIIIGREMTISALREWMAELGKSSTVAVSFVGKLKTVAQMVALPFLIYGKDLLDLPIFEIGLWLLAGAALLTVFSLAFYLKSAWKTLVQSA